jgi:hypothetical protein
MLIDSTSYLFDFNEIIDLDTEVMEIFRRTEEILQKFPEIEQAIEFDLDNHGLKKKELRIQVKRFNESRRAEDCLFDVEAYNSAAPIELKSGRPRLKAKLVFYFLVLRGLWGTISDHQASERIKDSISINTILSMHGYNIPGINTIRENLNAISNSTRKLILKCQAMLILEKGLDDFSAVYIDSTDVKGNTAYPTDISILYKLIDRVRRSFIMLEDFGMPVREIGWLNTRIERMNACLCFMSMNAGKRGVKGKVKEKFKSFSQLAFNSIASFFREQERLTPYWEAADVSPDKGIALDAIWYKIDDDLHNAMYALYYADLSINKNIKLPSREKILSISDVDAAYISKGQRVPVIGYKPQIARSQNGFICGYLTPEGNAADSAMLIPTVENVISITGIIPLVVSTDDGYASKENVDVLKNIYKIPVVSINGAKGKKLTGENWNTTAYLDARIQRSAAESGMFTLKYNHYFGKLKRRGIQAVHGEELEKVIAYNFVHMNRKEKELISEPEYKAA